MLKIKVLHVSESGKSALVAYEAPIKGTPFTNRIAGWIPLQPDAKAPAKDDEIELPFSIIEKTISVADDGTPFTWLSFS